MESPLGPHPSEAWTQTLAPSGVHGGLLIGASTPGDRSRDPAERALALSPTEEVALEQVFPMNHNDSGSEPSPLPSPGPLPHLSNKEPLSLRSWGCPRSGEAGDRDPWWKILMLGGHCPVPAKATGLSFMPGIPSSLTLASSQERSHFVSFSFVFVYILPGRGRGEPPVAFWGAGRRSQSGVKG